MKPRRDSYSTLRVNLRWRVALSLGVLTLLLMLVLGAYNTHNGYADTAFLAWAVLAVVAGCVIALLALPRALGGDIFFGVVAVMLVLVIGFGWQHDRSMHHWAYTFPPVMVFLARPNPALVAMLAFGVYTSVLTAQLLPALDVVRFASGYGMLVFFMYAYALLEERASAMLRFHSNHDALSNCLNRRTFNEALVEVERDHERCTFLLIDVDHFKTINDQRGHLVGDQVITAVAATLRRALEGSAALYRYGGEEFALMIDTDEAAGVAIGERLREAVAAEDFAGLQITVSIGVATWRVRDGSVAATLSRADEALYAAKAAGRNRVAAASGLGAG